MTDREMLTWFVVGTPLIVGFNVALALVFEWLRWLL